MVTTNVMYQQQKRCKTAADRLSDFKLGIGIVIKADEDCRGIGRPQVAMHHNCHISGNVFDLISFHIGMLFTDYKLK